MHVMVFLMRNFDYCVSGEHSQFDENSMKNYLSNIKNKIKAIFAYFCNDSCKVAGVPLKACQMSKIFCMSYFFSKKKV